MKKSKIDYEMPRKFVNYSYLSFLAFCSGYQKFLSISKYKYLFLRMKRLQVLVSYKKMCVY